MKAHFFRNVIIIAISKYFAFQYVLEVFGVVFDGCFISWVFSWVFPGKIFTVRH